MLFLKLISILFFHAFGFPSTCLETFFSYLNLLSYSDTVGYDFIFLRSVFWSHLTCPNLDASPSLLYGCYFEISPHHLRDFSCLSCVRFPVSWIPCSSFFVRSLVLVKWYPPEFPEKCIWEVKFLWFCMNERCPVLPSLKWEFGWFWNFRQEMIFLRILKVLLYCFPASVIQLRRLILIPYMKLVSLL